MYAHLHPVPLDFIQANPLTTLGLGSSASVLGTSSTGASTPLASATATPTATATAASALHLPTIPSLVINSGAVIIYAVSQYPNGL